MVQCMIYALHVSFSSLFFFIFGRGIAGIYLQLFSACVVCRPCEKQRRAAPQTCYEKKNMADVLNNECELLRFSR